MSTYETTKLNNLLQKYNNEVSSRTRQVEEYQKHIETERATINSLKEKINLINEIFNEIKSQTPTINSNKAEQKWGGLNNISKKQFNTIDTKPISCLTTEQIQNLQNTFIGLPQDNYLWASIHYKNKTP